MNQSKVIAALFFISQKLIINKVGLAENLYKADKLSSIKIQYYKLNFKKKKAIVKYCTITKQRTEKNQQKFE